jgi:hypothetical protein
MQFGSHKRKPHKFHMNKSLTRDSKTIAIGKKIEIKNKVLLEKDFLKTRLNLNLQKFIIKI